MTVQELVPISCITEEYYGQLESAILHLTQENQSEEVLCEWILKCHSLFDLSLDYSQPLPVVVQQVLQVIQERMESYLENKSKLSET